MAQGITSAKCAYGRMDLRASARARARPRLWSRQALSPSSTDCGARLSSSRITQWPARSAAKNAPSCEMRGGNGVDGRELRATVLHSSMQPCEFPLVPLPTVRARAGERA
eukprot:4660120-Pleurochrysis_carterae.AAC.2